MQVDVTLKCERAVEDDTQTLHLPVDREGNSGEVSENGEVVNVFYF